VAILPDPRPTEASVTQPAGLKAKPLRGGFANLDPDGLSNHAQERAGDAKETDIQPVAIPRRTHT
jgi:hypothetical protein